MIAITAVVVSFVSGRIYTVNVSFDRFATNPKLKRQTQLSITRFSIGCCVAASLISIEVVTYKTLRLPRPLPLCSNFA
ncbi:MAG: hypothetical protein ACTS47_00865 [Candidatus Hodgkinia cicadicola]